MRQPTRPLGGLVDEGVNLPKAKNNSGGGAPWTEGPLEGSKGANGHLYKDNVLVGYFVDGQARTIEGYISIKVSKKSVEMAGGKREDGTNVKEEKYFPCNGIRRERLVIWSCESCGRSNEEDMVKCAACRKEREGWRIEEWEDPWQGKEEERKGKGKPPKGNLWEKACKRVGVEVVRERKKREGQQKRRRKLQLRFLSRSLELARGGACEIHPKRSLAELQRRRKRHRRLHMSLHHLRGHSEPRSPN